MTIDRNRYTIMHMLDNDAAYAIILSIQYLGIVWNAVAW